MTANGDEAAALLEEIRPFMDDVPYGGRLVLHHLDEGELTYAVFLRPRFLFLAKNSVLGSLLGREDVEVHVVTEKTVPSVLVNDRQTLVLSDEGGSVQRESRSQW